MRWLYALAALFTPSAAAAPAYVCEFEQPGYDFHRITFADINTEGRPAQMIGNSGTSEVGMVAGSNGISFVEVIPSGAVMTTTIVRDGRNPAPAIHSRNTIIAGEFAASQLRGNCTLLD